MKMYPWKKCVYVPWRVSGHICRHITSAARTAVMGICLAVLICSFIITPSIAVAQGRGYGQAVGSGAPGTEGGMQERRFLKRGRLIPGEISRDERDIMAGFSQSVVSYQIHVLGEVGNPGTYRVSPSTRVDETLKGAGGVSPLGSTRNVIVRRAGGKEIEVDITDFRKNGNLASNPYVLDNDVIFIPYAEKLIRVEGAIRNTGVIELRDERTIRDVVDFSGGMTVDVLTSEPITVVRFDENGTKETIEVPNNPESLREFIVQNGDMIYFPNVIAKGKNFDFNLEDIPGGQTFYPTSKDAVFILGAVTAPGAYPYNPFASANEYILYAGPVKAANIKHIRVYATDGKKISGKQLNQYRLSPGDIIVVPEKALTLDKGLMWYNTFASTVMTGFTLRSLILSFK